MESILIIKRRNFINYFFFLVQNVFAVKPLFRKWQWNCSLPKLFIVAWCHSETQQKGKLRDFKEIIASFSQKHFSRNFESHWRCIALSAMEGVFWQTQNSGFTLEGMGTPRRPRRDTGPQAAHCSISAPISSPSSHWPPCSRLQRAASPSWGCSAGREVSLVDAEETEHKGTLDGQEKAITGNKKTRKEDYITDKSIYTGQVVDQPSINQAWHLKDE